MHVGGGRHSRGQKGDRMLIANISFLGLPKSHYRFRCLQLYSKGWQASCCVRPCLHVPGSHLALQLHRRCNLEGVIWSEEGRFYSTTDQPK